MTTARSGQTATLLSDGRVLMAGGMSGDTVLASAELYDPKTGTFTATGSMTWARFAYTANLLSDGRVLIAGGAPAGVPAELYNPKTGKFTATGNMTSNDRYNHTATLLQDGQVLIVGGGTNATAELYDPKTGTFTATGAMATSRGGHSATLLSDGRVLIAGGAADGGNAKEAVASAELYDPKTGKFSSTGSMASARLWPSATTLLSDGRVLIAGGESGIEGGLAVLASAELYDPTTGTFGPTGAPHAAPFTATLLSDGRVLMASELDVTTWQPASPELYDPKIGTFSTTGSVATRFGATATLLSDGRILLAGGEDSFMGPAVASAELCQP